MLADEAEALDATQDIFLLLQRRLATFRGEATIHTWIYRITTNHCLNVLRSRKARRRAYGRLHETEGRQQEGVAQMIERRDLIRHLLDLVSARKVQIAFHYYFDEMTQNEIAELLGISDRAVRKAIKTLTDRAAKEGASLMALEEE